MQKLLGFLYLVTVVILTGVIITSNVIAVEDITSPRFTLNAKEYQIQLNINLPTGYKLTWIKSGVDENSAIKFSGSSNLQSHHIILPPASEIFSNNSYKDNSRYYQGQINIPIYVRAEDTQKAIELHTTLNYVLCSKQCVPVKQSLQAIVKDNFAYLHDYDARALQDNVSKFVKVSDIRKNDKLWIMLIIAFLGGLVLNFMPCVLPVVSLKIMGLQKISAPNSLSQKTSLALTILGIIFSFIILALFSISVRLSGEYFNFGFNFQQPEFIIILTILMTIFISIVLDRVYLPLPSRFNSLLATHKNFNHYLVSFLNGIFATILSTPCTAPFLGSAMAFALSQDHVITIIMFCITAFGFAMPYWLLIFKPNLLNYLPKSGNWMILLKRVFAIAFILTILWLLGILYSQLGYRAALGLFLLLVLLKFSIECNANFIVKIIMILTILTSSLLLPNIAHNQDLKSKVIKTSMWHPFNENLIKDHIQNNKIVIVNITAEWCMACKMNDAITWDRQWTVSLLNHPDIFLMKGDLTRMDPIIQKYLVENHSYAIPFTKIYAPASYYTQPNIAILPTIVTYGELKDYITKFRTKHIE